MRRSKMPKEILIDFGQGLEFVREDLVLDVLKNGSEALDNAYEKIKGIRDINSFEYVESSFEYINRLKIIKTFQLLNEDEISKYNQMANQVITGRFE